VRDVYPDPSSSGSKIAALKSKDRLMSSSKETYPAPHLKNTASPTQISHAEYERGEASVMARYRTELNDEVTFVFDADGSVHYEKLAKVSPGGVTNGEVGTKINSAADWELVGKTVNVYFTVRRKLIILGQSEAFTFRVSAD
jgi:hypothetical protein